MMLPILHDSRVLYGFGFGFLNYTSTLESSKLFTREHRSLVGKEKHGVLPNCRCPVTSKIERVIGSCCCCRCNLFLCSESMCSRPAEE